MLRKKLSKLIVAVMAAVMLSGGMSGVGQAAFASSNASVVTTEARTPVDIDATTNTTDEEVIKHIKNAKVSMLRVNRNLVLTKDIVTAINDRITPLTIEVGQNGLLTISDAVSLNGQKASLKIVRGAGKKGVMISQNATADVVIENVNFDNNGQAESAFGTDGKFKTTLRGNKLVDSVVNADSSLVLQDKSNPIDFTKITFEKNVLNTGKLLSLQTLPVTFSAVPGSTVITLNGSIKDDQGGTSVNVQAGSTAEVIVKDDLNKEVFKKGGINLKITPGTGDRFSEASFSQVIDGLAQESTYTAKVRFDIVDERGNEYVRNEEVKNVNLKTEGKFSSSAVNVGNNSATININHGGFPEDRYNLKLVFTNGIATVEHPDRITVATNSVNLTGLSAGTRYNYEIRDNADVVINTGTFTTTSSTITGGGSTGGSVVSGDITTNDINRADIKDVSVSIPVGSTTLANSLRDGRDYKTNIEGVTVTYSNGKVEFTGLVPEKDYRDLTITYTDKDGRTRTVKVPSFKTKASETKLRQFIVDVYKYSLDRVADERGFAYWEDQLKNKKTSPDEFVKNLLNEREFINKHTTTTAKIEGLYQVIVNRKSDSQGLSFWTKKYDDLVARGYSESMALRVIVDEMVNEQEFKNRVQNLGL